MPAPFPPRVQPLMFPTLLFKSLFDLGECPSQPGWFPVFTITDDFRGWEGRGVFKQMLDRGDQNVHEDFALLALLVETSCRKHRTRYEVGRNWWEVVRRVEGHEGNRRCQWMLEM